MAYVPSKQPTPYSNRDALIGFSGTTGVKDPTVYQPFKGFYVSGGGDFSYYDWNGAVVTLTSVQNGIPIWVSGQALLTSASGNTAGSIILFQ